MNNIEKALKESTPTVSSPAHRESLREKLQAPRTPPSAQFAGVTYAVYSVLLVAIAFLVAVWHKFSLPGSG